MDVLSETMNRLCADINSLRRSRHQFRETLQQETHQRRAAVEHLCHDFAATRAEMGKNRTDQRLAFVSQLQRSVSQHCRALQNDLRGARRAWLGQQESPRRGRSRSA